MMPDGASLCCCESHCHVSKGFRCSFTGPFSTFLHYIRHSSASVVTSSNFPDPRVML